MTIMERQPCGMEEYGKYVNPFTTSPEVPQEVEKEKSPTKQVEEEKIETK